MSAEPSWRPADELVARREKLCDGPRCANTFTPTRRGQRFCSDRCEQAAGVTTLQVAELVAQQRPCATCDKPFKPSKTGWTARYCSFVCMRARNPVATTVPPAAGPIDPPDPEPQPQPQPESDPPVAPEPEPGASTPPPGDPPPPPPYLDDEEHLADARYDGYIAGAQAAMELVWRLLRSDAFRELDQETATAIVVEVLA